MSTSQDHDNGQEQGDPHTDVAAAQDDADATPVTDDCESPAADEDRNP